MRADRRGATAPQIWEQIPWLAAIGQQLREEYTSVGEAPLPEHLTRQLERIEAGTTQPEPAAVRLAIINAVVRASAHVVRRSPFHRPTKANLARLIFHCLRAKRRQLEGLRSKCWTYLIII